MMLMSLLQMLNQPSMTGLNLTWSWCVILYMHVKSLQSCPALCDGLDCSPPGSSVHGTLQERVLEGVATPSSKGFSRSRNRTCISCLLHWQVLLHQHHLGSPVLYIHCWMWFAYSLLRIFRSMFMRHCSEIFLSQVSGFGVRDAGIREWVEEVFSLLLSPKIDCRELI